MTTGVVKSLTRSAGKRPRRWLRWIGVLLVLLAAYALAGFALVPWLVKTKLPEFAMSDLQRRAAVGDVRFNPFKLYFEARDLKLDEADGTPIVALDQLVVDLGWDSLTRRAWSFDAIKLGAPRIHLVIGQEGRFNLAELIAALDKNPPREKQPLPRLLIGALEVAGGRVDFDDRKAGHKNALSPVAFTVNHLSTLPENRGPHTLTAKTAAGGTIRWKGEASLNPIAGSGQLVLDALSLSEMNAYIKSHADLVVRSGRLGLEASYKFAYNDGVPHVEVVGAKIGVTDLALARVTGSEPFFALPVLSIAGVDASLARREVAIGEISLEGGKLSVQRDASGALDLAAIVKGGAVTNAGPVAAPPANAAGWKLRVGQVGLDGFSVNLRDHSLPGVMVAALEKVQARLGLHAEQTSGGFKASVSAAQVTAARLILATRDGAAAGGWSGALDNLDLKGSIAAEQAAGVLKLAAPAVQATLGGMNLALRDASGPVPVKAALEKVQVALGVTGEDAADGMKLKVTGARFSARNLNLSGRDGAAIRVDSLGVDGAQADFGARSAVIDRILIRGGQTAVKFDAQGRLNLLGLAPAGGRRAAAKPGEGPAWKGLIKVVDLAGLNADVDDASSGVRVNVQEFGTKLAGVGTDLRSAIRLEAGFSLKEGGRISASGLLRPADGSVEANLKVSDLALAPVQAILARHVRLKLAGGSVSAQGKVTTGPKLALRYAGSFNVSGLRLNEEAGAPFLAWKNVAADEVALTIGPNGLDVGELRVDGADGKLLIEADRSMNAAKLLVKAPDPAPAGAPGAGTASVPPPGATTGGDVDPFPVNIRRIRVNDAKLVFEDLSLRPQFGARIHELNGVITGLASDRATRSRIELDGRVDEFGSARIRGELNPFAPRANTDLGVVFRNVDLITASPYSMKFAGYKIAAGKISLDLRYKVKDSKLDGENKIVLDQLTLGERVDSPDALNLPLELAIAILKDSDGRIDLDLPVAGSLDDPQFSYGAVVWKAIVNLVTRIITAPFRALGGLFGMSGETLEAIDFDPGSAALTPPEREKLRSIAQILDRRRQLKLAVPGAFSEMEDTPVLKRRAMRIEVLEASGLKTRDGEEPGPLDYTSSKLRGVLRDRFAARIGAAEYERLRAEFEAAGRAPAAPGGTAKPELSMFRRAINLAQGEPQLADPGPFNQRLADRLAEVQPLPGDALQKLAVARAAAIADELKKQGVDAGRITQSKAESASGGRGQPVRLKLGLAGA